MKINKEEAFNKNVFKTNKVHYDEKLGNIFQDGFYEGLDYAESHYKAIIDEKDELITHQGKSILKISEELTQAKELLKELFNELYYGEDNRSKELRNKINEFLKK